jgi:lysophospholipase L1-like esterase
MADEMDASSSSPVIPTSHHQPQVKVHCLANFQVPIAKEILELLRRQYNDEGHFQRLLDKMKTAPRQTVLRLTRPKDSRQEKIETLRKQVNSWLKKEGVDDTYRGIVLPHPVLDDIVTIDVEPRVRGEKDDPPSLTKYSVPDPNRYDMLFPQNAARMQTEWPMTHLVVIVDRMCGEAVLRGSDIFVGGIVACDSGIRRNDKVAVYVNLTAGATRGSITSYRGECIFLGVGHSYMSRSEYFTRDKGRAIRLSALPYERASPLLPPLDDWLKDGSLLAQNLPSAVVGHIVDPRAGECILDVCAAPGGKTSHLAQRSNYKAKIVMADRSRAKVKKAVALFRKSGCIAFTRPLSMDGIQYAAVLLGDSDIARWPPDLHPSAGFVHVAGSCGATLKDCIALVPEALRHGLQTNTSHVLVVACAGENDIGQSVRLDESCSAMAEFLSAVFATQEERVRLIFLGPKFEPWLNNDRESRHDYIRMSQALEKLCAEHVMADRIFFINCLTMFCGESADSKGALLGGKAKAEFQYFDSDLLHLSQSGYSLWNQKVEQCIRELLRSTNACIYPLQMDGTASVEYSPSMPKKSVEEVSREAGLESIVFCRSLELNTFSLYILARWICRL